MSAIIADRLVAGIDDAISQLEGYVACASVSADPAFAEGMEAARQYLFRRLPEVGLENMQVLEAGGHPAIYADWLHREGAPTVLIYGHYDVMPPDPLGDWHTDPFRLTRKGDRLYGRGAADNKGSSTIALQTIAAFLSPDGGGLPLNVKLLIEGEEECGAPSFDAILEKYSTLLAADFVISADGGRVGYWPAINIGCRGLVGLEISLTTAGRDLHSGRYGGAVRNATHELARVLASLHDADGHILVEGFLPDEARPTAAVREESLPLSLDEAEFYANIGAVPYGEPGYAVHEKLALLPTIEVNGISGGYQGPGPKTVIPRVATAKLSLRLVPGQEPDAVLAAFTRHVEKQCPPGVTLKIERSGGSLPAYSMNPEGPLVRAVEEALLQETGRPALRVRHGGTLPVASAFHEKFGLETLLFGFGVPDDAVHAPNESYAIQSLKEGLRCWPLVLSALAKHSRPA